MGACVAFFFGKKLRSGVVDLSNQTNRTVPDVWSGSRTKQIEPSHLSAVRKKDQGKPLILFDYFSFQLSAQQSVPLPVLLQVQLTVQLPVQQSVPLSVPLPVQLTVQLSVQLPVQLCLCCSILAHSFSK
jgi:hypothetical protein